MKLLIVEDNASVRRILKTIMAAAADEILECDNGEKAFFLYRLEKPDFVLMDINLGETTGIIITRRIRDFDADAKIVIVTSYDEKDFRQAAADAGAIGFVVKDDLSALTTVFKKFQN